MSVNTVTLLGYYGGDETHCLSAWQSTNIELGFELPEDIHQRIHALYVKTVLTKKKSSQELLAVLAEHRHHSPFEKSTLHFQVRADIASHIHLLKHRIGTSINTESARYKELTDKWYIPEDWKDLTVKGYIISDYLDEYLALNGKWDEVLYKYVDLGHQLYHQAVSELTPVIGRQRAKESARYFLSYAKQLDFDVMVNFRSFMHFQSLRNTEHAQKEIRDIAQLMLDAVKAIPGNPFEYSLAAFNL